MKFEKEITLVAFEVEYYDHRQPKPRPLLREDVILDGGRISALERLGIRPAGYIAQQFERSGYAVTEVRWGERIQAQVDLAELWNMKQLKVQEARLTDSLEKYQAAETGGDPNEE